MIIEVGILLCSAFTLSTFFDDIPLTPAAIYTIAAAIISVLFGQLNLVVFFKLLLSFGIALVYFSVTYTLPKFGNTVDYFTPWNWSVSCSIE